MIEMVMMVVIMGIAFATLPMVLSVSARSVESVAEMKAVYHGVAKMRVVSGKAWDESNTADMVLWGGYNALGTAESATAASLLWCGADDNNRSGHYPGLFRRKCSPGLAASALGADGGDRDDLDDFDGENDGNFQGGFTATTTVAYVSAPVPAGVNPAFASTAVSATTTPLKRITVTMNKNGAQLARYHYYAADIGMPKPYIREMQP